MFGSSRITKPSTPAKSRRRDRLKDYLHRNATQTLATPSSPPTNAELPIHPQDAPEDLGETETPSIPSHSRSSAQLSQPPPESLVNSSDDEENSEADFERPKFWDEVWKMIDKADQKVIKDSIAVSPLTGGIQDAIEEVVQLVKHKMNLCERKRWTFTFRERKYTVREEADKIINWLDRFKQTGDVAVNADPIHAGLPWALIRIVLQAAVSDRDQMCSLMLGIERVSYNMNRCNLYWDLYFDGFIPKARQEKRILKGALRDLYTHTLGFLAKAIHILSERTLTRAIRAFWKLEDITEYTNLCKHVEAKLESAVLDYERRLGRARNDAIKKKLDDILDLLHTTRFDETIVAHLREAWQVAGIHSKERRGKVMEWTSLIPHIDHHATATAGRVDDTGEWLLQRPEFRHWNKADTSMILWLHGIPGAGKTKLITRLVDTLRPRDGEFTGFAFFYCNRYEEVRRKSITVLQSFVKQLASSFSDRIYSSLRRIYEEKEHSGFASACLSHAEAAMLLKELVGSFSRTILILDALDECHEADRATLIDFFDGLIEMMPAVTIIISSRRDDDITRQLRKKANIGIEASDNQNDIQKFVEEAMSQDIVRRERLRMRPISLALRNEIVQTLSQKSQGMFQWAALQIQQLLSLHRESDIRARLGRLPIGLSRSYDEIMARIEAQEGSGSTIAFAAFQWLLGSTVPMPIEALVAAVLQQDDDEDMIEADIDEDYLLGCCQNLVITDKIACCRFAHLSIQEYLESLDRWPLERNLALVRNVCLKALLANMNGDWTCQYLSALQHFAFEHWISLTTDIEDSNVAGGRTMSLLQQFIGDPYTPSPFFIRWIESDANPSPTKTPYSPIFLACFANLLHLCHDWIQSSGVDVNLETADGDSLLSLAIQGGCEELVRLLLKEGADVNKDGMPLYFATRIAATRGDRIYLQELVTHGVDVNMPLPNGGYAIEHAIDERNESLARYLLQAGANPNVASRDPQLRHGNMFSKSLNNGYTDIARLLLTHGANYTAPYYSKDTHALLLAIKSGDKELVELLLQQGADPNVPFVDDEKHNPFIAAILAHEDSELPTILLRYGAKPDACHPPGFALVKMCMEGSISSVLFLLNLGANVNVICDTLFYGIKTPLQAAAERCNVSLVRILIEKGADVTLHVPGSKHDNALSAAGNESTKNLLKKHGAIESLKTESGPAQDRSPVVLEE